MNKVLLMRWTIIAVAIAALAVGGCSSGSGDDGGGGSAGDGGSGGSAGSGDCSNNLDIAGGFEERYNCQTDGVCTDDDITIYLDIRIDPSDQNPSDGVDYSFCETGGLGPLCIEDPPGTILFSGSGTLCGSVFTWTAISPDRFTEAGVWTFSEGGDVFDKVSEYMSIGGDGGGTCVGKGRRGGGADDPGACVP